MQSEIRGLQCLVLNIDFYETCVRKQKSAAAHMCSVEQTVVT